MEITDQFGAPLYTDLGPEPGPYDYDDVSAKLTGESGTRLDLGSVILPLQAGFQLQVEMAQDGTPQAVHLTTEHGRLTVAAYAAPKSPGQWREVAGDLAESLRNENAGVSVQDGPWGRELMASTEATDLRFIGVDGYRWMLRLVAAGPSGSTAPGAPLVVAAHAVLRETIVRRGNDPHPVRTPLPVVLPQELAEQLAAAHQQQLAAAHAAERVAAEQAVVNPLIQPGPAPPVNPPTAGTYRQQPRRGADGSAMQQLRR
jgi:hypothetical protein